MERLGGSRFEIVRHLGEGGMGVVYEARDNTNGGLLAIKTLRSTRPEALVRLKKEFRALQELSHPNLVQYHELIEENDRWFLAMELVRGRDLRAFVRGRAKEHSTDGPTLDADAPPEEGGFEEDRLRNALGQLASALMAIHRAGKVHRDIKPSNVMVEDNGRVVLLDFGLVTDSDAQAGWTGDHVVGTVAYMAPEQVDGGGTVGPAADWYALGALTYELLTDRLPFNGRALSILLDKQRSTPPPVLEVCPGAPKDLAHLCDQLLRKDPEERAGGPDVLRALGAPADLADGTRTSASLLPSGVGLVGRDVELSTLRNWLPTPGVGTTTLAYVTGESGVGKTLLVEGFLRECAERVNAVVLRGKCYERETLPFRAVDAVVDSIATYLKSLPGREAAALTPRRASLLAETFPVLRGVDAFNKAPALRTLEPLERRQLMFDALRELLNRLGDRAPLVLCIDDFHWVDNDSLALLRRLLLPGEAPSMLLIATWRATEKSTAPPSLPGVCEQLPVERLTMDDAVELASLQLRRLGVRAPGAMATSIAREAGGHPLFIDELVRHAAANETTASSASGMSLDDALWQRVQALPHETRLLVEIVSVAGHPVEPRTLAGAVSCSTTEVAGDVSTLRVARLLRTSRVRTRDSVEPYHARVRESVLGRLEDRVVKEHHRALAHAMKAQPTPDLEALARHLAACDEVEAAAEVAADAAAHAVNSLAFDRGAALYRLALSLVPDNASKHVLHAAHADALAQAGRGAEAARAYDAARVGAPAAVALDMQWKSAQQWLVTGHVDDGLAALGPVLRARGVRLPRSPRSALLSLAWQRARLRLRGMRFKRRDETEVAPDELALVDLYWYVGSSLGMYEPIRGHDFYARGVLAALRSGEPRRIARGLYNEAAFRSLAGLKTRHTVDRLIARGDEIGGSDDPHLLAMRDVALGISRQATGRFENAWSPCDRAEKRFRSECPGATVELSGMRAIGSLALMWIGDLQELRLRLKPWLHESRERGHRFAEYVLTGGPGAYLQIAAGAPTAAIEEASVVRDLHETSRTLDHYALCSTMSAAIYAGTPQFAQTYYEDRRLALKRSMILHSPFFRATVYEAVGRVNVSLGALGTISVRDAIRNATRSASIVARCNLATAPAWANTVLAGAAMLRRDLMRARALVQSAAESFGQCGLRLHAAAARRRCGQLIGGDEGAQLISAANQTMLQQGVVEPARFAATLVPGPFPGDGP